MNVHVHHVGSSTPAVLIGADFKIDDHGNLIVTRQDEDLALFAATKWSAAIKIEA